MSQHLFINHIPSLPRYATENDWIWVSRYMGGKMKGIWSINSNPLTNAFCIERSKTSTICAHCYSRKMLQGLRKNCLPAFQHNNELLSRAILPWGSLPILNREVFRFNAHGELINNTHYLNLLHVAQRNPNTIFGWWTKRYDLVLNNIESQPKNVIFIYSNPLVNDPAPRVPMGFNKIFSVYTKDYLKTHNVRINCKGSKEGGCNKCRRCYSHNNTKYINEVMK